MPFAYKMNPFGSVTTTCSSISSNMIFKLPQRLHFFSYRLSPFEFLANILPHLVQRTEPSGENSCSNSSDIVLYMNKQSPPLQGFGELHSMIKTHTVTV